MTITRSADGGALAGVLGEARRDERAAAARAAVGPDRELGPERLGRLERELGPVAGLGRVEPALHRLPGALVAAVGEQDRLEALQLPAAEVVRAPLQHLDAHVAPERGRCDRDVLREQLLLERLRRGGDDDAAPRLERRHEVREALADAGAGLGDEVLAGRERVLDAGGERSLLGPRLEVGKRAASAPPGPKTSSIGARLRERTDVPHRPANRAKRRNLRAFRRKAA